MFTWARLHLQFLKKVEDLANYGNEL